MARKKWGLVFGYGSSLKSGSTIRVGENKMENKKESSETIEEVGNSKYNISYEEYKIFGDPTFSPFENTQSLIKFAKSGRVATDEEAIRNFKNYYDLMVKEEYYYLKQDVATLFDFNAQFVQKFMKDDFKLLLLSRQARNILRCADYINRNKISLEDEEEQKEVYKLALDLLNKNQNRTTKKIFYRKIDILNWIKKNFKRDINGELKKISDVEATEIFNRKLVSNKTIKKDLNKKHDEQVTRIIKNRLFDGSMNKYVMYNTGGKRPIIRYLLKDNNLNEI